MIRNRATFAGIIGRIFGEVLEASSIFCQKETPKKGLSKTLAISGGISERTSRETPG